MIDVELPTTDDRLIVLSRYTEKERDQQLLLQLLQLHLPEQPRQKSPPAQRRRSLSPKSLCVGELGLIEPRLSALQSEQRRDERVDVGAGVVEETDCAPSTSTRAPWRCAIAVISRWQIELAFKRLKTLLRIDCLPAKTDKGGRSWIYAHLILAIATDACSQDFLGTTAALPAQTIIVGNLDSSSIMPGIASRFKNTIRAVATRVDPVDLQPSSRRGCHNGAHSNHTTAKMRWELFIM